MLKKITSTKCSVQSKIGDFAPEIGIVLGSGLGALVDRIEVLHRLPYAEIEGFPISTVAGHEGALIFGTLAGKKVVVMQGRFHYYEGYTPQQVTFPIRVMKLLGIHTLFVSNAAGGLNQNFVVGDIMAIQNHINFIPNPLIGPNIPELGERFTDMSEPYSTQLIDRAQTIAQSLGFRLQRGCYVGVTGPSYETATELRFFHQIGGDTVGMSTTPEVIVARHMGLAVFAVSVVTNIALSDKIQKASHHEVVEAGKMASSKLTQLFYQMAQDLEPAK